jgi:tRNA (cmo5U34)-methyltransferase
MSKQHNKDQIYAEQQEQIAAFRFDDKVAGVFDDMIQRSVPGYGMILEMIGVIAQNYVKARTNCYDLGCSLGASTLAIRHNILADDCRIHAIDNSTAMTARCKKNIDADSAKTPVEIHCEDIQDTLIEQASLVTMNFTLQFVPAHLRLTLLKKINSGMIAGGALVLSEKIQSVQSDEQALLTELHHAFKRSRGYSDLEIAQKRTALENVLIPDSLQEHRQRLLEAGFSEVFLWFQCFNFVSLIAIK